jgi:hypothetical protein
VGVEGEEAVGVVKAVDPKVNRKVVHFKVNRELTSTVKAN